MIVLNKYMLILKKVAKNIYSKLPSIFRKPSIIHGSDHYWKDRYNKGLNSGIGSYGKFAEFKASILNNFVKLHSINLVIEFGCGDGNQLSLARYNKYHGYDISEKAIALCNDKFSSDKSKLFSHMSSYKGETADLTLSLDVIYHLIEDNVFENYMRILFGASTHYVIIYSSDSVDNRGLENSHVRHRKFTEWVRANLPNWQLIERIPNKYPYAGDYTKGSFADFFVYERLGSPNDIQRSI